MRTVLGSLVAGVAVVAACSGGDELPDEGPPPPLSDPILSLDPQAAVAANNAQIPNGFALTETVCATDTTRGFLEELLRFPITDLQVAYEWAPVIPGPLSARPTLYQPQFFSSGTVVRLERSGLDFRPSHPFGFDTTFDAALDAPFTSSIHNRPGDPNDGTAIHAELESGLYPDDQFMLAPAPGDRVLMQGSWILDCGHPPYEAEVHPPVFFALARASGGTTSSIAFAVPYRVSQLYGSVDLVDQLASSTRWFDPSVGPFTTTLVNQITRAAFGLVDQFELHALLEPVTFSPVTWFVCAGPRPSDAAKLSYSFHFVARSGVTVTAARRGDSGCLSFHAEAAANYAPPIPPRADYLWTWAQVNAEASLQVGSAVDVRQAIIDELASSGFTGDYTALHTDVPIVIDQYPALAPRADFAAAGGTQIVSGADDQPFPFYGKVTVRWE